MGFRETLAKMRRLAVPQAPHAQMSRAMRGVNAYWRQLRPAEIAAGEHRRFVGGLWEEMGQLQFNFMRQQGLQPFHKFIDLGCGALRGGVHFIRFLDPGHYYGLDINASLIQAGIEELRRAGLVDRHPHIMVDDKFALSKFGTFFDYGLAVSLFTHLHMNCIVRCLAEIRQVMLPTSRFYLTYFEAPTPRYLSSLTHQPGNMTTNFDADPFHYAFSELESLARQAGLTAQMLGAWDHPRAQSMLCLTVSSDSDR